MPRLILLTMLSVLLFVPFPGRAQLPPIIDRELFFGDPEISGAQISPDGSLIAFVKPFKGVRNLWVKGRTEGFEAARPLTADTTRPVSIYFWSRDSRYILYAQDKGGDENYRVYAVDPKAAGDPVPQSRDLTPLAKVRAMIIDVPLKTPNEILVGLNDRRADLHDVYRVNLTTGERTLLRKNDDNVLGWVTDLNGALRLGVRQTPSGGFEILRIDPDGLVPIYSVTETEECSPLRFTPDGKKFYLQTNKGTDKQQLELFSIVAGKSSLVEKDPLNQVDFGSALFSDVTNELLATFYVGDTVRAYPKQKKFAEDYARLKNALPAGEISITGMTADENVWVVVVSGDVDPGSRYLYDRVTGKAELLYRARPTLQTEYLAHVKPLRYKARDGMMIPAYLTLPKGVPAKNLPVVINPHGGPWFRDNWGYNAEAQFLANRGYAVLQPNFRGSTGYGKKFLNAGNKQWGRGSMQHDISDGVLYLIKQGIADPKRVGIYGGSYGGYATLAGLAFTPDLYAAGVSYVGPSNIITLLNSIPPYWEPMKKIFAVRVGDKDNPAERKMMEAQSPLNSADSIRAPLLVVQGANDPRVKKAESDRIVVAMRDRGRQVEYLVAPDEGHGFAGKENRLALYTAMERFFAKYLGGRAQESVAPEIQKKLEALTVDVKTLSVAAAGAAPAALEPMPEFRGSMIKPDMFKYASTATIRGQKMTMSATRAITSAERGGRKVWRVIEESSGPMGASVDTLDLDAVTAVPLHESGVQGTATMVMTFDPDSVNGKISAGGMVLPLHVKLVRPALLEGAGLEIPLATLALEAGLSGSVDILDVMGGKVRTMSMQVSGPEDVTVAAGAFHAHVVQLTPRDGERGAMKIWIDAGGQGVVKTEVELPSMAGGGSATTELAK